MPSPTPLPIYEKFLSHCSDYSLPEPWSNLSLPSVAFRAPELPLQVLGELERDFGQQVLIESGLALHAGSSLIWPAPTWSKPGARLIPLGAEPAASPFDLIVDERSVRGDSLPVLGVLGDYQTLHALESQRGSLLVTMNIDDMIVLRSLGFATATASGLNVLDANQLHELQAALSWSRGQDRPQSLLVPPPLPAEVSKESDAGSDFAAGSDPDVGEQQLAAILDDEHPKAGLSLVFVGWLPSQLSLTTPFGLDQLKANLSCVVKHLGFGLRNTTWLWQPTPRELDRFQYVLQLGDLDFLREALLQSLDDFCFEFLDIAHEEESPDLLTARRDYSQSLAGNHQGRLNLDEVERDRQRFETALEHELALPLRERGRAARDPRQRALYQVAAEQTAMVMRSSVDANSAMTAIMAGRASGPQWAVAKSRIDAHDRQLRNFLAVIKELK